jgi:hypothetical protein
MHECMVVIANDRGVCCGNKGGRSKYQKKGSPPSDGLSGRLRRFARQHRGKTQLDTISVSIGAV